MSRVFTQEDIDEYYEDEQEPVLCPYCIDRGYRVLLGPKILMPNEPRPEDYENWLQCPTCYEVIPIYEAPKEETIKDRIETIDNPFDNKTIIESVHNRRTSKTGKKIAPRGGGKKRRKKVLHEDPEINEEMRRHGDRVKVVHDSNP